MKCPNCGKPLHDNCCIHCGYMTNGVIIDPQKKQTVSDLEKYLGQNFDKITRNENNLATFILGPLYLSYNYFIIIGTILSIADIISILFIREIFTIITNNAQVNVMIVITPIIIFFSRLFWVVFDNIIYIKLLNTRIDKLRKMNDFDSYIKNKKTPNQSMFGIIMSLMIIVILFVFVELYF